MTKEIIPSALFNTMLEQAKKLLGKKPQVSNVDDHIMGTLCQGGKNVNVHSSSLDLKGVEADAVAAWIHNHPVLTDGIQFQASEDHVNQPRLAQTMLDAACEAAGCANGLFCALKRDH